jgi:hypothetical protein
MRKNCDHEEIDEEILTDLHMFSHPDYEKVVFGTPPFCTNVCLGTELTV